MTEKEMTLSGEGFQFIGRMTASVTHEIKNALAVIRENAGLMEDLIDMGERKGGVDPARIRRLAGKIGKQAMKADGIVQNMNRFAHSMDEPVAEVDLGEMVQLLTTLSSRLAAMREITLGTRVPDTPVWIHTRPLFLETLLWGCLDFAMAMSGPEKRLDILLEEMETERIRVRMIGIEADTDPSALCFPPERLKSIRCLLEAEVECSTTGGELVLTLPKRSAGVKAFLSHRG